MKLKAVLLFILFFEFNEAAKAQIKFSELYYINNLITKAYHTDPAIIADYCDTLRDRGFILLNLSTRNDNAGNPIFTDSLTFSPRNTGNIIENLTIKCIHKEVTPPNRCYIVTIYLTTNSYIQYNKWIKDLTNNIMNFNGNGRTPFQQLYQKATYMGSGYSVSLNVPVLQTDGQPIISHYFSITPEVYKLTLTRTTFY